MVTDASGISRVGPRAARVGLLVAWFAGGCAPAAMGPRTHVARVETLRTGVAGYDRFFSVVYTMQLAINECERQKIDVIARLAHALGLAEDADLSRCATAVRALSNELSSRNLQLGLEIDPGRLAAALNGPPMGAADAPVALSGVSASSAPPELPEGFPETQDAAERDITVEMRVAGGALPIEFEPRVAAVRAAIRSTMALERRMDSIVTHAPLVRSVAVSLAATTRQRAGTQAAALDAEFRDAVGFLDGAPGRAQAQGQSALQVAVRLRASANSAGVQ